MTSSYLLHVLVVLSASLINTIDAADPVFLVPVASTAPRSVSEDEAPATSILTLEGQDTDGNPLTFSIVTQTPTSPPFELESVSGLLKVPSGLDAEVSTSYEFVFGVRDGSTTTNSVPYRVNIVDKNDNIPIFTSTSPANATVQYDAPNGTNVTIVTATDADVTPAFNTVRYSIVSGNDLLLFALDQNTGQITVSANLSTRGNETFVLTLQASDGTFTAATPATVNITVTDYCTDDPCQNGGTCTNMDNGYNCSCAEGFFGQNCSQEDHCYVEPCQNGGTCTNMDNGYNCSCAEGFLGQNCSRVDYCYDEPCQNGGNCTNMDNGYNCSCAEGFLGQNCSRVDYCYDEPCQNGGNCTNMDNGYNCSCAEGFLGQNCSRVDYCYDEPCQNGGSCTNMDNGYNCSCAEGFLGQNCSRVDYCKDGPCQNGGNCTNMDNEYNCSCAEGFLGQNCSQDYCSPSPCQHGSTCSLSDSNNYTCACVEGYQGRNCSQATTTTAATTTTDQPTTTVTTAVDNCASSPCQNGGTCNNALSSYTCTCANGYTGTNCADSTPTSTTTATTATGDKDNETECKCEVGCVIGICVAVSSICVGVAVLLIIKHNKDKEKRTISPGPTTESGNDINKDFPGNGHIKSSLPPPETMRKACYQSDRHDLKSASRSSKLNREFSKDEIKLDINM